MLYNKSDSYIAKYIEEDNYTKTFGNEGKNDSLLGDLYTIMNNDINKNS